MARKKHSDTVREREREKDMALQQRMVFGPRGVARQVSSWTNEQGQSFSCTTMGDRAVMVEAGEEDRLLLLATRDNESELLALLLPRGVGGAEEGGRGRAAVCEGDARSIVRKSPCVDTKRDALADVVLPGLLDGLRESTEPAELPQRWKQALQEVCRLPELRGMDFDPVLLLPS